MYSWASKLTHLYTKTASNLIKMKVIASVVHIKYSYVMKQYVFLGLALYNLTDYFFSINSFVDIRNRTCKKYLAPRLVKFTFSLKMAQFWKDKMNQRK